LKVSNGCAPTSLAHSKHACLVTGHRQEEDRGSADTRRATIRDVLLDLGRVFASVEALSELGDLRPTALA